MPYHITTSDSNKIIFERDAVKGLAAIFVGAGSLFLFIGIMLNVFMDSWEMPNILFRLLFPGFGSLFIGAGLYIPKQTRNTTPEQITFDHNKALVIIEMIKGGNEMGYIRYDEIEGFDIHVEKQTSSSSSGRSSSTTYTYHVFLKKKDGGEWFLTQSGSLGKAEAALSILRAQVALNKPSTLSPSAKLTAKISKQEGIDKTVIHWQNKVSFWMPVFLIVFSVVFLSILSTAFSGFGGDMDFFVYGVVGFMVFVFLIVMVSIIRKLIKDATTRYAVAVSKVQLEYYEFSKSTGTMKNQKALPIENVDRIVYSFAPAKSNLNSTLRILTREDVTHWQKVQENPLTALKDIFTGKNQPITLSITALNPVECLQLESWLQELILKKSEKKVL